MKPIEVAKQWAKNHQDQDVILEVITDSRKGKGGWGYTPNKIGFAVSGGRAAQERQKALNKYDSYYARVYNGLCPICKKVYVGFVIHWVLVNSSKNELTPIWTTPVDLTPLDGGPKQYAQACEDCIKTHNLTTYSSEVIVRFKGQISEKHPSHLMVWAHTNRVELDIREYKDND